MEISIHIVDLIIVIAYVCGVVVFGVWMGRDQKNLTDYLLAGRDLPWWIILGSIIATETSTATFLSVPGIAFAEDGDLRFLQLAIGLIVGRILVAVVLIPQYFRGNLFTAYEVLEKRFGGLTRRTASVLFLAARTFGDGLRLFLAAIVLETVTGLGIYPCILFMGLATIIYTFIGGMKAVVWNDCIQLVVYVSGAIVAGVIILAGLPGGLQEFWEFAESTGRLKLFDFGLDLAERYTFWAGLIGGAALAIGTHGTDQMMVQRYLSARSQRDASVAVIASGFAVFVQFALFLLLGIGLACFYQRVSAQTTFENNDEVFATFIVGELPVGLVGITLAAVFSAAMSTLSSSLSSSASAATSDLYQSSRTDATNNELLRASRALTAVFGVLQMLVAAAAVHFSESVVNDVLAIASFLAGILLGVFGLGIFTKKVGQVDALIGMCAGVALLMSVKFATPVAWTWYAIIGAATTFAVAVFVSRLRHGQPNA